MTRLDQVRIWRKISDLATRHTLLIEADDPCLTEDIIQLRKYHDFYCQILDPNRYPDGSKRRMSGVWRK